MFWVLIYIGLILGVNYGFTVVPLVDLGDLGKWPPMSLAVGLVFVARDYAQRAVGHWVLAAMAIGIVLSYVLASPFVAVASACAFAISELADWIVYTATKRPFRDRILISSAISTPIDSIVFLSMIGHFSIFGAFIMTLSKIIAALVVWRFTAATAPASQGRA